MSLSVTLSSALSGLQASSRAAELVSTNVANALTEGYGRREIQLSARNLGSGGSGVSVTGVLRNGDPILLSDRRGAEAQSAGLARRAEFFSTLEGVIGTPETASSIGQRIDRLDSALLEASSRPDSEARLAAVLDAAKGLAGHLGQASRTVQAERARADDRIATQVQDLNDTLRKVAGLNARILKQVAADRDASPLIDQRQQLIDAIAGIVPMREIQRENGQIALVTAGGAVLVDGGRAATFGFTPAGTVTADMALGSGALSGLNLNGKPVPFLDGTGKMDGGTLAADFRLRDRDATDLQARLDAVARDLIDRFADPSRDPTLPPGAPGLFTDSGAAFDPMTETGLAGRIAVNAAADPEGGGALWRLRDGLGAVLPGPPGQAILLDRLRGALSVLAAPASGGFGPGERSLAGLASDLVSGVSKARTGAEAEQSFASAMLDTLRADELALGVDSDRELQELLLIERAYAANAKVVGAVDEMLRLLLGM
jgi:flagellar hook-associated protein 1 FlgK